VREQQVLDVQGTQRLGPKCGLADSVAGDSVLKRDVRYEAHVPFECEAPPEVEVFDTVEVSIAANLPHQVDVEYGRRMAHREKSSTPDDLAGAFR
jgi:hypothetical protein